MQTVSSDRQELLSRLPHQPGVYLMKGRNGTVLYVGKGVVLAHRIKSYFQKGRDAKTAAMVARIESIETIVTGSELEALLLENNLIKKYRPKYNIILRDDKNYPLLRLPVGEDYPRLEIVRRVKKDGALYFGPYIPSQGLYEMLRLLRRLFPLPNCTIKIDGKAERPCIEFEIKRCLAPCTGHQSKEAYREMIQSVRLFLEGKNQALIKGLQEKMAQNATALHFEEAARIRDQISRMKRALERQRITSADLEDQDVLALYRESDGGPLPSVVSSDPSLEKMKCALAILFIRNGMVLGKKEFFFDGERSDEEILSSFLQQFYDKDRIIPPKVILPIPLSDQALLQQWLSRRCGRPAHLLSSSRGASRSLMDLAMENAKSALEGRVQAEKALPKESVLIALRERLPLSRLPNRIEGYDISNIMGTAAVGSMVVFEGGVPKHADYRHFKIKTIDQANDFGMMAEVLTRRVAALREREGRVPDLILIDGGKGQISAAREVLEAAGFGAIDLIGLAKERDDRPERVYLPDLSEPIALPVGLPATHLLMRVRDEAHRFAVSYHRKVRSKNMLRSPLETIAGIGKKRRLALLRHFGSMDKIREASLEEMGGVVGLHKKVARQLFDALHPQTD